MAYNMNIIDFHEEALEIYNNVSLEEIDADEAASDLQRLYKKAKEAGLAVGDPPSMHEVGDIFPGSVPSYDSSYC